MGCTTAAYHRLRHFDSRRLKGMSHGEMRHRVSFAVELGPARAQTADLKAVSPHPFGVAASFLAPLHSNGAQRGDGQWAVRERVCKGVTRAV